MNAVSTSEASGSAAKASAAGTAIFKISCPSSSSLNTRLVINNKLNMSCSYSHARYSKVMTPYVREEDKKPGFPRSTGWM